MAGKTRVELVKLSLPSHIPDSQIMPTPISPMQTLIAFATSWGPKFGGINSFNYDLLRAFAACTYVNTRTVCVVPQANVDEIAAAKRDDVILISLDSENTSAIPASLEAAAWQKLGQQLGDFDLARTIWLGHDRISGDIALAATTQRGGRSALIHHMSYAVYESFAETSSEAQDKVAMQKRLFQAANILLAVGPLLRDALHDLVDTADVTMLVPGLAEINERAHAPKSFTGFLSGRLSDSSKKIKQSYLGIAAFASAIQRATADRGLPDGLHGENEPKLRLRGVDFENNQGKSDPQAEPALKAFAEEYAGRAFPLSALPFTTERKDLFDEVRNASVALMPSWHEGFGLVAWEAIAAGVPLIVTSKSGVHKLLVKEYSGFYTAIDVAGQSPDPFFTQQDCKTLADAIIQVAKNRAEWKGKASSLREKLLGLYTWHQCAASLARALGWESSVISAAGTGHVAAGVVGGISSSPVPVVQTAPLPASVPTEILPLPQPKWHAGAGLSDSQLLRAEEAIIPFDANREPFLAQQLGWAQDPAFPLAVRLLIGAGGAGKTRLALECCHRLRASGWQAGVLPGDWRADQANALARQIAQLKQPILVVIDYAETRQTPLLALLKAIQKTPYQHAVRVLLLARDGGEWWQQLPGKDADCEALLGGYASTGPYPVPVLHDNQELRQQAYQTALTTFAGCLAVSPPNHTPTLAEDYFSQPLYLQMVALLALRGERPETAEALMRALVNHERRYWQVAAGSPIADIQIWQQQADLLTCLATLAGGFATVRELEPFWQQAGGDKNHLKPLFRQLAQLYPGEKTVGSLPGLRPDLLGETLVAQVLLGPDGAQALLAMLKQKNGAWRHQSLSTIARMLRHRGTLAAVVENVLQLCFMTCAQEIMKVCVETESDLPQIVERAYARLADGVKIQVAGLLVPQFRFEILPLGGLNVLLRQTLVENAAKKRRKKAGLEADAEFAGALENLAVAWWRVGQLDNALESGKLALAIWPNLIQAKPEWFEPDFATSLSNYSQYLADQGQHDQALQFAKQALDIREKLARTKPERFEPNFATSLSNYATCLANQGLHDQATQFSKQALAIREKLARAKPERFEPDLAASLSDYAIHLDNQGQHDQTLQFTREAMDIRERLAQAKPERFEPDFAMSLCNLSIRLADIGQWKAAIAYAVQASQIYQRCAARTPARYNGEYEQSRLNASWFQWLDDGTDMAMQLAQLLPVLAIAREQNELQYWHDFLFACSTPEVAAIQTALGSWAVLDKAQQIGWQATFIILAALAEKVLGPHAAPPGWRQTLAALRTRYRGNLPQWVIEATRRLGCDL
jgi:glycosyltransferase involved in cell wall biosynthesis/Tfp pilus assembly protein PilF